MLNLGRYPPQKIQSSHLNWTINLKQFLNYQKQKEVLVFFFLELLISSSSILLSLFDTQIMNCLARQKTFFILKESSKCHNIKYWAKNHVVMVCFGLQSIARFINTNVSYFNTHTSWIVKDNFPETFKSQQGKNKNLIHRPRSVRIGP